MEASFEGYKALASAFTAFEDADFPSAARGFSTGGDRYRESARLKRLLTIPPELSAYVAMAHA